MQKKINIIYFMPTVVGLILFWLFLYDPDEAERRAAMNKPSPMDSATSVDSGNGLSGKPRINLPSIDKDQPKHDPLIPSDYLEMRKSIEEGKVSKVEQPDGSGGKAGDKDKGAKKEDEEGETAPIPTPEPTMPLPTVPSLPKEFGVPKD